MSTRANIIIYDNADKLYFYRHSDGYPEVTETSLKVFMGWLKQGRIRDNVQQAAGWLIKLGATEYNTPQSPPKVDNTGLEWKVGAYEPTTELHCDVEFIYEINLVKKTLRCWDADRHPEFKAKFMKGGK